MNTLPNTVNPVSGRPVRPVLEVLRQWGEQQHLRQVRGTPALSNEDRLALTITEETSFTQTGFTHDQQRLLSPGQDDQLHLNNLSRHDELLGIWVALQTGQRTEADLNQAQKALTSQKMTFGNEGVFPDDAEHPAYRDRLSALIQRLVALTLADSSDERAVEIARWSRTHSHVYDWSHTLRKLGFHPELIAVLSGHRSAAEIARTTAARENRSARFDSLMRLNELHFQCTGLALQQTMKKVKLPIPESAINPTPAEASSTAGILLALLSAGRAVSIPEEVSYLGLSTGARHVELALRAQALPFPETATYNLMDWNEQAHLNGALVLIACTPQSVRYVHSPSTRTARTPTPPRWLRPTPQTLELLLDTLKEIKTPQWRRQMIRRAIAIGLKHADTGDMDVQTIQKKLQNMDAPGQP